MLRSSRKQCSHCQGKGTIIDQEAKVRILLGSGTADTSEIHPVVTDAQRMAYSAMFNDGVTFARYCYVNVVGPFMDGFRAEYDKLLKGYLGAGDNCDKVRRG